MGSKTYFRTQEMVKTGIFRCYNCNKLLVKEITGSMFILKMKCNRCSAEVTVKCNEAIPILEKVEKKEMVNHGT